MDVWHTGFFKSKGDLWQTLWGHIIHFLFFLTNRKILYLAEKLHFQSLETWSHHVTVWANKMEVRVTSGRFKGRAQIRLAHTVCPSPSLLLVQEYRGRGRDATCDPEALNHILRMAVWQEPGRAWDCLSPYLFYAGKRTEASSLSQWVSYCTQSNSILNWYTVDRIS